MKNLLICTDGSDYSMECCRYGAWLSERTGAQIAVLYVTDLRQFEVPAFADLSGSLGVQPYEGIIAQLQEVEAHKAKFIEEQTLKLFEQSGIQDRVNFYHQTGLLVDTIGDYADRADMILIGKRGENANFATEHLGSMLERIVRSSKKPCFVTSRKCVSVERILIAYDGGESCRKALDFVSGSQLFRDLELHIVTVAEPHEEDRAAEHLNTAESLLKAAGLNPTCQILSGDVETAIASYIETKDMHLLIAGAYGHSRILEFFIGSTTTELLRRCHVSVICFR